MSEGNESEVGGGMWAGRGSLGSCENGEDKFVPKDERNAWGRKGSRTGGGLIGQEGPSQRIPVILTFDGFFSMHF